MAHNQQTAIKQMTRIFNDRKHPDRWTALKALLDLYEPEPKEEREPVPQRRRAGTK